jgi:hypothetical protein
MLTRVHAETGATCGCGCGVTLKSNQRYASPACKMRAHRASKPATPVNNVLKCKWCGGWKVGTPKAFICDTCAGTGYEPLLRVSPRAEGHPRLYYGYMILPSQEADGTVQVFTGDTEVKPVLKAFTEAMGGRCEDHDVVLVATIPTEALKTEANKQNALKEAA